MENKNCTMQLKSLNTMNKIAGYASVFNIKDYHNDIIKSGAFAKSINNKSPDNIKILWQHQQDKPIGLCKKIYEDHYGLYIEAELLLEIPIAKEAYALVKAGVATGLSIGYKVDKSKIDEEGNRILEEIDLWEISLVTFPANQLSQISEVKFNAQNSIKLLQSIRNSIKILTF